MRTPERLRQFIEGDYGWIAISLLQSAYVLLAEAGPLGDLFLGQAPRTAYTREIASHQFAHVHGPDTGALHTPVLSTIICNRSGEVLLPGVSRRDGALIAPFNQADPVCEAVQEWLAVKAEQERLEQQWQGLEHKLMKACKASGREFAEVSLGRSEEACVMRELMAKIKSMDAHLEDAVRRILVMPAGSPAGALALIELGLAIQAPLDCEDHAWALVRGGAERLRALLDV